MVNPPKNKVIGLLFDPQLHNFVMYTTESSGITTRTAQGITEEGTASSTLVEKLPVIKTVLDAETKTLEKINHRFVLVYPANTKKTQKREYLLENILKVITKYKKNELSPDLVIIGHENTPLPEDITKQYVITERASDKPLRDEFQNIVHEKMKQLKQEPIIEAQKQAFHEALKVITQKSANLKERGYTDASDKANALYTALDQCAQNYFKAPNAGSYQEFKTQTQDKIKQAVEQELGKHRGM